MFTKKPYKKYIILTKDRNQEQVKYKYIVTKLRSDETYNNILLNIRNKNHYKFKIAYKNVTKIIKIYQKL